MKEIKIFKIAVQGEHEIKFQILVGDEHSIIIYASSEDRYEYRTTVFHMDKLIADFLAEDPLLAISRAVAIVHGKKQGTITDKFQIYYERSTPPLRKRAAYNSERGKPVPNLLHVSARTG